MRCQALRLRRPLLSVVGVLICAAAFVQQECRLAAAEPLKATTGLKFAPADVAFYSSCLRNREVFDAVVSSKAFARIKSMPYVQILTALVEQQWNNPSGPAAQFKEWFEQDENQELLALLKDMISNEVVVYGDDGYAALWPIIQQIQHAPIARELQQKLKSKDGGDEEGNADSDDAKRIRDVLTVLSARRDELRIPNTLLGFKLSDTARATAQLKRLEDFLKAVLDDNPAFASRFQREKLGDADYLTLRLDGKLVPWGLIPFDSVQKKDGEFDALQQKLMDLKLNVALGVRGGYLILALGDSTRYLSEQGAALLYDRAELAPLRKAADKPLLHMSYVSQAFLEKWNSADAAVGSLMKLAEAGVAAIPGEADAKRDLLDDVGALKEAVRKSSATAGARVGFCYLQEEGYDAFVYDYGSGKHLDGSKKLTLLEHLGGDPLAFSLVRGKDSAEQYATFSQIAARLFEHGEKLGLALLSDDDREEYTKFRDELLPLVGRLDKATSGMLIPALKDGQVAVLLDATEKSKQWFQALPAAAKPLPMLELALVFGVSDEKLLRKAVEEYFAIAQDTLEALHELEPEKVPEIELPEPESKKSTAGTIYYYPLPEAWGVDEKLVPCAAATAKVAVLSTSPSLIERVLTRQPLEKDVCPLAAGGKSLAAAGYLDWPGFVDVLYPWVDYGARRLADPSDAAGAKEDSDDDDAEDNEKKSDDDDAGAMEGDEKVDAILAQVRPWVAILKCYGGLSQVKYLEGKALVTQSTSLWEDLDEDEEEDDDDDEETAKKDRKTRTK